MKRYIQKIRSSSSATKLLILIGALVIIVLFASTSFYIQYKKGGSAEVVAGPVKVSDTALAAKNQASSLVTTLPNSVDDTSKAHADSDSPTSNQEKKKETRESCKESIVTYSTLRKEAPWLDKGKSQATKGKHGYKKVCGNKVVATQEPVHEIIYQGTRPLSSLLSPVRNVVEGTTNFLDTTLRPSR